MANFVFVKVQFLSRGFKLFVAYNRNENINLNV